MTIYHTHHILPRHAGGTDDPNTLVRLTIEEHAEAHKILYETYGREEDRIAWLGLSGSIGKEELILKLQSIGASIGGKGNKGICKSDEHREKISNAIKIKYESQEMRDKTSAAMRGNVNSKNHSSEEYRKAQSERLKAAWKKRKNASVV